MIYYRILEEETKSYSPFGYNETSQKEFKKDVAHLLELSFSYNDINQISNLKWDVYKSRLRSYGYLVQDSTTPYQPIDTDDWSFDDDEDDLYDEDY